MPIPVQRLRQIGAGAFSVVYEANIPHYGRVAVKELISHFPDDLARFRREVHIQSQLHHPGIVPILIFELDTNTPWFAMPLAQSNLDREMGRLYADRALLRRVFRQILDGMEHAHDHQVIHRDLKPENLLWYEDEAGEISVKIADFGLGKLLDPMGTFLTQTGQAFGSIAYIAPEQLEDTKSADARADIYALGKLLYKALTLDNHPMLDIDVEKIEPEYRDLLLKSTAWNADDRYQSVAELRQAFDAVGTQGEA